MITQYNETASAVRSASNASTFFSSARIKALKQKRCAPQVISSQFLSGAPQLQTLRLWCCKPRNMFLIINKNKTEKPYVKTSRLFVRLNSSDSATTTNGGEKKRRELLIEINALRGAKEVQHCFLRELNYSALRSEITAFIFTRVSFRLNAGTCFRRAVKY